MKIEIDRTCSNCEKRHSFRCPPATKCRYTSAKSHFAPKRIKFLFWEIDLKYVDYYGVKDWRNKNE